MESGAERRRPGVMRGIQKLVVLWARENPSWDYRGIEGALANLGQRVARSWAFRTLLTRVGVNAMPLPACSPVLNAWIERFPRPIKEDCLDRMIVFGGRSLHRVAREFIAHKHGERNHQGVRNRILELGQ